MKIFGLFIQKLGNLRRIRDVYKLIYREQQIEESMMPGATNTGVDLLAFQQETHGHLAAQAALSYWHNQNPTKIMMSYGKLNRNSATATSSSLKPLILHH